MEVTLKVIILLGVWSYTCEFQGRDLMKWYECVRISYSTSMDIIPLRDFQWCNV